MTQGMLLLILTSFLISCAPTQRGVEVDFYMAVPDVDGIMNEEGKVIKCSDNEIKYYACLHKEDIKELSDLAERRVSKWER